MHGLAALVPRLRSQPGSYGLVYANGGMMTKHSVGIYSTRPWASTHGGGGVEACRPAHDAGTGAGKDNGIDHNKN
eukprot:COSAG01_NODE_5252_length_4381_cov_2.023343_2_plen_75_part_00